MLKRFTERARQAVVLATEEARARRHEVVGPEHLLMGLLRDADGLGAQMLERLQVSRESLRSEIERVLGEAPAGATTRDPRFSADLKAVFEATVEEQWRHGHHWVGTEHLLLGLLGPRSTVSPMLRDAGADLDAARGIAVQLFADARQTLHAFRRV